MPRLSFTLRDLFWLTLNVGMSVWGGWIAGALSRLPESLVGRAQPKGGRRRRMGRLLGSRACGPGPWPSRTCR
jgi:hypothetical protein